MEIDVGIVTSYVRVPCCTSRSRSKSWDVRLMVKVLHDFRIVYFLSCRMFSINSITGSRRRETSSEFDRCLFCSGYQVACMAAVPEPETLKLPGLETPKWLCFNKCWALFVGVLVKRALLFSV